MTWAFTINLSLHNSQSNKKTLVKMQHGAISLYITDLYGLKYQSSTASSESEMIFISWKSWIFLIQREFSHLMCIHLLLFKKNKKFCVWIYWVDSVWPHKEKGNKIQTLLIDFTSTFDLGKTLKTSNVLTAKKFYT